MAYNGAIHRALASVRLWYADGRVCVLYEEQPATALDRSEQRNGKKIGKAKAHTHYASNYAHTDKSFALNGGRRTCTHVLSAPKTT